MKLTELWRKNHITKEVDPLELLECLKESKYNLRNKDNVYQKLEEASNNALTVTLTHEPFPPHSNMKAENIYMYIGDERIANFTNEQLEAILKKFWSQDTTMP